MSENTKTPLWFWIVSAIALLWNTLGVVAYLAQTMNREEFLKALEPDQVAYHENLPTWVTGAFALAVFGGLLGSLLLLLRKKLSHIVLNISVVAVFAQLGYNLFIAKNLDTYGPGDTIMAVMIPVFAVGLVLMAKRGIREGWIS